jgi:hypothetical protein
MEEVIRHSLGMCGEGHPSLLNISGILVAIGGSISYIKYRIKAFAYTLQIPGKKLNK